MRIIKILTSLFLIISLMLPFPSDAADISVSAESAVLVNADDMEILYSKNSDTKLPMASTTKIMTALVALEKGKLDETVKIPKEAAGIEGTSLYLKENDTVTLNDLLYGVLLQSANDAAEAVALYVGKTHDGFVSLMNEKASGLGLVSTHFDNPHGLDSDNHYTTARELAIITSAALKNQKFSEIVSTKSAEITVSGEKKVVVNHNKLLSSYNDAIGVKTGFTKMSGRCLVSAAKRNGISLIAVTLHAPNDWNDHKTLLDYGFAQYDSASLSGENGIFFDLSVVGGQKSFVRVGYNEKIVESVRHSDGKISCCLEANMLTAPVKEGDSVGYAVFLQNGKEIAKIPLISLETVEKKTIKKSLIEQLFD